MRAIGFSEYTDRKKLKELLTDVIMNSDHRAYTMNQEGILLGEFSKNHTHTKGTGYHFDKRLVFESDQFIEIFRSFYSFHFIAL